MGIKLQGNGEELRGKQNIKLQSDAEAQQQSTSVNQRFFASNVIEAEVLKSIITKSKQSQSNLLSHLPNGFYRRIQLNDFKGDTLFKIITLANDIGLSNELKLLFSNKIQLDGFLELILKEIKKQLSISYESDKNELLSGVACVLQKAIPGFKDHVLNRVFNAVEYLSSINIDVGINNINPSNIMTLDADVGLTIYLSTGFGSVDLEFSENNLLMLESFINAMKPFSLLSSDLDAIHSSMSDVERILDCVSPNKTFKTTTDIVVDLFETDAFSDELYLDTTDIDDDFDSFETEKKIKLLTEYYNNDLEYALIYLKIQQAYSENNSSNCDDLSNPNNAFRNNKIMSWLYDQRTEFSEEEIVLNTDHMPFQFALANRVSADALYEDVMNGGIEDESKLFLNNPDKALSVLKAVQRNRLIFLVLAAISNLGTIHDFCSEYQVQFELDPKEDIPNPLFA